MELNPTKGLLNIKMILMLIYPRHITRGVEFSQGLFNIRMILVLIYPRQITRGVEPSQGSI